MAIAHRATGGVNSGNNSVSVDMPGTAVSGDLAILSIGTAEAANTIPAAPAGWTFQGTYAAGNESFGTLTGPRAISIYTKVVTTGDGDFTVTQAGGAGTSVIVNVTVLSKAANETWDVANIVYGSDLVAGTSVSVTANANPGIASGDWLLGAFVQPKNATHSAQAFTATSATIGAATERMDSTGAPGSGNRITMTTATAAVTAGTASAAPVFALTSSQSNTYGAAAILRVRVQAGGNITAAHDVDNDRIGVTLGSWIADEPTVIYRVHTDGSRVPVRGGDVTPSGGAGFVWDYEFPTNEVLYYVADDSGTERASNTITITDTRAWLRAPGLPGLDTVVRFARVPERSHARPTTFLTPIGRRTTVPVSDSRKAPTFTLEVVAATEAENDAVHEILDGAPTVWLLWPNTRHHGTYVALGDAVERVVSGRTGDPMTVWTVQAAEVARPAGGILFDPTASWQAILDTSASWTAVSAGYTSWLDVLQGPEG